MAAEFWVILNSVLRLSSVSCPLVAHAALGSYVWPDRASRPNPLLQTAGIWGVTLTRVLKPSSLWIFFLRVAFTKVFCQTSQRCLLAAQVAVGSWDLTEPPDLIRFSKLLVSGLTLTNVLRPSILRYILTAQATLSSINKVSRPALLPLSLHFSGVTPTMVLNPSSLTYLLAAQAALWSSRSCY